MSLLNGGARSIRHADKFFIGGRWVEPSSASMFDVIDSGTEEVLVRVAEAQAADLARAVGAAREAFDRGPWPRMTPAERAGYLRAFADGLAGRSEELGQFWTRQSGVVWARGQITGRVGANGPVLSVIPADDEEDSIAIANDTIYGLNSSVFTHDVDRAREVARKLRSGTVGHNAARSDLGIAAGGFKQSGVGREGGVDGLLPFVETKTVILEGWPAQYRESVD